MNSLENYLRAVARENRFEFIPKNSTDLKVHDLARLGGGQTNEMYSFSLEFHCDGIKRKHDIVLKGYRRKKQLATDNNDQTEIENPCVREFQVLQNLGKVSFPVPHVYLYETNPSYLGLPFLAMEKLEMRPNEPISPNVFASILVDLHSLNVENLGLTYLAIPKDGYTFADVWNVCFEHLVSKEKFLGLYSKSFDLAAKWIGRNAAEICCPRYCLLHGDYHLGNFLYTQNFKPRIIDWENAMIGDAAFDVAYAFHMLKIFEKDETMSCFASRQCAENFVLNYTKNDQMNVAQRLEFYKVVAGLKLSLSVLNESQNSNRSRLLFESLILRFPKVTRRWFTPSFSNNVLRYFEDFFLENFA